MKLTAILFLVGFMQVSATVYSQATKFSFNTENKQIVDVLKEIEESSNFRFLYIREQVDVERQVSVNVKNATVEEILDDIFAGYGVTYKVMEDNLILLSPEKNPTASVSEFLQQQKSVSGTVTDNNGQPLPGVTVVIKGTTTGTVTDVDGKYTLSNVPDNAVLQYSFVGMQTQEVVVGNQTSINIQMAVDAIGLDEVVAIGYGVQKKANLTGAIANVNTERLQELPVANLSNALGGKLAGVFISQNGGKPGKSSEIRIRANGTWNNASPLFVIDGFISDQFAFDGLDPSEVENISVLKDGASAAVYGSRAANGVILVTTKRGKAGKSKISYTGSVGVDTPINIPKTGNAYEQAVFINDALTVNNIPTSDARYYTQDELDYFKKNSWDWIDEAWQNPVNTRHSLNASGGNEKIRYYIGGNYYYATGSFDNLDYKKYDVRANIDANITKDLLVSLNLSTGQRFDKM